MENLLSFTQDGRCFIVIYPGSLGRIANTGYPNFAKFRQRPHEVKDYSLMPRSIIMKLVVNHYLYQVIGC